MRCAGGVSKDRSRTGRQFRARLCHFGGLLDLGRFETEKEAKLAYDQAVRSLRLDKSLNYPHQQSFSPDVERKVQAFLDRHTEPSDSSSPPAPSSPEQHASQAAPAPAGSEPSEPSSLLQLAGQEAAEDCSVGTTPEPLLSGEECVPWDEAALQACTLTCMSACMGAQQQGGASQQEPARPGQQLQQQDDTEVIAALYARILAEEEEEEQVTAVAVSPSAAAAQHLQECKPFLQQQQHACSAGYAAAPAPAYLPAQLPAASAAHLLQHQQYQQHVAADSSAVGAPGLPQQQALLSSGEVLLFVDTTTQLLVQLYHRLTANNSMQHAGLTAVQWMSDVCASLSTHALAFSTPGMPGSSSASIRGGCFGGGSVGLRAPLQAAVLHICSSLVSMAACGSDGMLLTGGSYGMLSAGGSDGMLPAGHMPGSGYPFASCFLLAVLEQVLKALMALRSLCAAAPPMQGLGSAVLHAWWQDQLQAQASTEVGQAVASLLGAVLGAVHS